jgi:hypothetical protein
MGAPDFVRLRPDALPSKRPRARPLSSTNVRKTLDTTGSRLPNARANRRADVDFLLLTRPVAGTSKTVLDGQSGGSLCVRIKLRG